MEEVPLLSHLTILSVIEKERMKAIIKLLPSIDEKIEKGIKNSAGSTSNYSEPFWIYFRDTLVVVRENLPKQEDLPEQEESSIWLSGELDKRIKRIRHIIKNDHNKREVLGKI